MPKKQMTGPMLALVLRARDLQTEKHGIEQRHRAILKEIQALQTKLGIPPSVQAWSVLTDEELPAISWEEETPDPRTKGARDTPAG